MIETGVLFDDIHSFRDLNLVLAPFVLVPAKPRLNYFEVPGRDGSIDASEVTGRITYSDREFSFTFTVFPEDPLTFEERQTVVSNALNGKKFKITIEKDPDYYLIGRCTVNEYFANKKLRQIVVSCRTEPYKMRHQETVISAKASGQNIDPNSVVLHNNGAKTVPVDLWVSEWTILYDENMNKIGEYNARNTTFPSIFHLKPGITTLYFDKTSHATHRFIYREGDL